MIDTRRPKVMYFVTHETAAKLFEGQFDFLSDGGFDIHVGSNLNHRRQGSRFDSRAETHHLDFKREPQPYWDLRCLIQAVRLVRKVRPDVVNSSTPKAGLIGCVAAWLCGVRVRIYVVRGIRWETTTGVKRRLFRLLERLTIACSTDVICNSFSVLGFLRAQGALKPTEGTVLLGGSGNGIDTSRYRPEHGDSRESLRARFGIPADAFVIGFVGRLSHDKGIADLVAAFESDLAELPESRLLLVGPFEEGDPLDPEVVSIIRRSPQIVHVEWLDDTCEVFQVMDVLVFPSFREGLPNVVLESQASGVCVVGYAATGTVDAVADGVTGLLVPTGDSQALGEAIVGLCKDSQLRMELSANGPEWVRNRFDRVAFWRELESFYLSRLRDR